AQIECSAESVNLERFADLRYKPIMEFMQSLGATDTGTKPLPENIIPSWQQAFVRAHDCLAVPAGFVYVEKAMSATNTIIKLPSSWMTVQGLKAMRVIQQMFPTSLGSLAS
ncbi:unnamed protein product, partial [Symbiodinium pilosum]